MSLFPRKVHVSTNEATKRRVPASPGLIERLEGRQLLSATNTTTLPTVSGQAGSTSTPVDLTGFIDDPAVNTQVRFATALGNMDLELFDQQKPNTVRNFLNYVRSGRYDGTIIHRSTAASTGLEVIQGGGYQLPLLPVTHIPTDPAIQHEGATINNTRGTISMARQTEPNTATSEFFINTVDNPVLDNAAQPPGYVVFGQLINSTVATADAIHAIPTFAARSPYGEIPLRNYTQADLEANRLPTAENVVSVTAITLPKLTYNVSSTNTALVSPVLNGNRLSLQFGQGEGSAQVTVTGTDAQGLAVSQTFTANVTAATGVTIGGAAARSLTFADADGTTATVSIKGAGTATVNFSGTGVTPTTRGNRITVTGTNLAAASIAATGTDAGTTLTISARGGANRSIDVGDLTTSGPIRAIAARTANLTGTLTTGGAVGTLDLAALDTATLTLGGAGSDRPSVLRFGAVTGTAISSAAPIRSITATSFAAAGQPSALTAPSVDSIVTRGDFVQNVTLTGGVRTFRVGGNLGGTISADTINALIVGGNLTATVNLTRPFGGGERALGSVRVTGAATGAILRASGNIGAVTLGSATGLTLFAGLASNVPAAALPAATTDFAAQASIASLRVRGAASAVNVAAFNLGRLAFGTVQTSNNGTTFGLAGDTLASATGRLVGSAGGAGTPFRLRNLDTQADVLDQTEGLTLGDFRVNML